MEGVSAYEVASHLATLITEMRHVRDDIKEIKETLPALDDRLRALELEKAVWSARVGVILAAGSVVGSAVGALVMLAVTKLWP